MGQWRISTLAISVAALLASFSLEEANAENSACYGTTIQVQAHAKEESLVGLLRELRLKQHMANLLPAKRVSIETSQLAANSAEAHYASHAEFRCAQELLAPTGAKLVATRLNRNLRSGIVVLYWNEKGPVLYGAKSE